MKMHNQPALDRARAAMAEAGADLLLIDQGELLAWLTGYTVSETLYRACLLPLHGAPWMVLRQLDEAPCRAAGTLSDIITFSDHQDSWQCLADTLLARGYGRCRLGADFNSTSMTVFNWRQLAQRLPEVEWVDLTGISERLRQVKFPAELDNLRQAAAIADSAMDAIARQVTAGWRVREVAALAASVFLREGADSGETGPIVLASGDNGFLHAQDTDAVLKTGDILHAELIPKVRHYSARVMRPFSVGRPDPARQGLAQRLVDLQDAQLALMKPGAPAAGVDACLRQAVLDAGLRPAYDNVTGYALGLYTRTTRPSDFSYCFTPAARWRLEERMVFHMYVSAQALAFSESVVVTPQGGRRLSRLPRRLITLE